MSSLEELQTQVDEVRRDNSRLQRECQLFEMYVERHKDAIDAAQESTTDPDETKRRRGRKREKLVLMKSWISRMLLYVSLKHD